MKKLTSIIIAVVILASLALPVFADTTDPIVENETKTVVTEATTDVQQAVSEANADKVTKSDLASFRKAFVDLFTELNKLRATAKSNWESIKSKSAEIKKALAEFKKNLSEMKPTERKAKVKETRDTLKPLHDKIKSIHEEIKSIRAAKKAEWEKFHIAVKAKDKTAAETALKSIISLKSQIITKQGELLAAKQSLLDALTALTSK